MIKQEQTKLAQYVSQKVIDSMTAVLHGELHIHATQTFLKSDDPEALKQALQTLIPGIALIAASGVVAYTETLARASKLAK